ncbi:hypothetical protein RhiirA1_442501 [Rhizophagus irregularis]|uniref:Ricin B lectin domain-containing protein n=1 Tax=Rhizophagus irregularis TaxID=588596 RepID=A0A2N0RP73_9GLOM|nr:hypothetical protein RhiirA1_442501 [Rhizophagus irregularis]
MTKYYWIIAQHSEKVLEVENASIFQGAKIIQASKKFDHDPTVDAQLWYFNGAFITNKRTGFVFDVAGGTRIIQFVRYAESCAAQEWEYNYEDKTISLKHNRKFVLDVLDAKKDNNASIVLFEKHDNRHAVDNRSYYGPSFGNGDLIIWGTDINTFSSYCYVCKNSYEKSIRETEDRFSVEEYEVDMQLWYFNGGFITNKRTGLVLDVVGGKFEKYTNIVQDQKHAEPSRGQEWVYNYADNSISLKFNRNFVLDVAAAKTDNNTNIQLWEKHDNRSYHGPSFGNGDLIIWGLDIDAFSHYCSSCKSSYEKSIRETDDRFSVEEYEVFQLMKIYS